MLFLNAQVAYDSAKIVAEILASELSYASEREESEAKAF